MPAATLDLAPLVTILNTALGEFLDSAWLVIPVAIGVGLAIWGVRRLFNLGKSLAS